MDRVFPPRIEYYSASVLESLHLGKLLCVRPNLRLWDGNLLVEQQLVIGNRTACVHLLHEDG